MRSTQLIEMITRIEETADIAASNPRSRRRRGLFGVPMTRRSGARFTTPRVMIQKSARLSASKEDATTSSADTTGASMSRSALGRFQQ
jgi:hypothetical protein